MHNIHVNSCIFISIYPAKAQVDSKVWHPYIVPLPTTKTKASQMLSSNVACVRHSLQTPKSQIRSERVQPKSGYRLLFRVPYINLAPSSTVIRNQLITSFARKNDRRQSNRDCTQCLETPRDCTHSPTLVKVPTREKSFIIFVQVCLLPRSVGCCAFTRPIETYHQGHSNGLNKGSQSHQDCKHAPALFPLLFSSHQQDCEGGDGHALQNHSERHQKAH